MGLFARVGWIAFVVAIVATTSTAGCGNVPTPTDRADVGRAPTPLTSPARATSAPKPSVLAAAAATGGTCAPRLGHEMYGTTSCETCHPCGTKATTGHLAGWMDSASPGFHAYSVNTGIAKCQACHGAALDGVGGSAKTSCAQCHDAALPAGVTSWKTNCVMCHGGTANQTGAPPKATWGNSADTVRIGAHAAHVGATHGLAAPVTCSSCHAIPGDALAAGHIDDGTAEVAFSGVAVQGTTTAAWTRGTATCSNTYCHGMTLPGGTAKNPIWTTTDGSQIACGSCHGAPPPPPHAQSADCGACHAGFTATTAASATHIDGTVQFALGPTSCGLCHGAPPANPRHKTVVGGITTCVQCHGDTVTSAGAIIPGGKHQNGAADLSAGVTCSSCHGTPGRVPNPTSFTDETAAAPPRDTSLNTATSARGVGAHVAHTNGTRSKNLLCTDCHPWSSFMNGFYAHADGFVDVGFSPIAGATAGYVVGSGGSCSATYCHGNFPGGSGAPTSPVWTSPAGALACTSCHGNPPALSAASHHPANANCAACHGVGYSSATVVQATHVDGAVKVSRTGCTLCHGDLTQTGVAATSALAAPGYGANAADTAGNVSATFAAVGAHAAHLTGTRWRSAPIACAECHVVPGTADVAHATGTGTGGGRATVAFGTLARTGSIATAAYAGSTTAAAGNVAGTCSNTYCHGNFKNGATTLAPSWLGGAAAAACGSCHGLPPGGTHPVNATTCATCHTGYTSTTVNPTAHMNGAVDVANMTCTSCHGTAARVSVAGADVNQASAPPNDSLGAATGVRVGTHVSHVNPAAVGAVYKPIACNECHPDNTGNISHSNSAVNVSFATATAANLGSYAPTFVQGNGTTTQTTCATYCHGSSLNATTTRGSVATWSWNGAAADCGSCHKSPPGTANHHNAAALTTCVKCHAGVVDAAGAVVVAGGLHVNGAVNTSTLACNTCHGNATLVASGAQDPNVAAAPTGVGAPDTFGNTAVATANGVGVHAAHVLPVRSKPVLCNACHAVPTQQIHKTGAATAGAVALGNLATTGAITTATYAGAGGTCSNTYCHGNLGGGVGATNVTLSWKTAGALACNSCHGMPPSATSTGRTHPNRSDCGTCHTGYTGTTVNATTHVNGVVDYVAQTCTSCHGTPGRTGTDADLVALSSAPPVDASNATTGAKVGAHVKHLLTGAAGGPTWSKQVTCAECHNAVIPATPLHANGQPNVAFGTLAKTGTVTPTYTAATGTCSNTYCHGNFKNGVGVNAITWSGTATCGSCHGNPPGGTHPQGSTLATCGNCHGNYSNATQSIVNPAGHVDGAVDLSNMSCTSCHGTTGRVSVAGADLNQASAPPLDSLGAATGVRVGTHVAHSNPAAAGAVYKPIACTECHPNHAGNSAHGNAVRDVTFAAATAAKLGNYAAGFVLGNGTTTATTCATYCHGATLDVTTTRGSVATWSWNGAVADCGSCHKSPPGTANHHNAAALTTCVKCHAGVVDAAGAVVVAGGLHVNGAINTSTLSCTTCHGNATLVASGLQDPNVAAAPTGTGAPDTFGNTAIATANGVGVHAAHVLGTRSRPVQCNACHGAVSTPIHKTGAATAGAVTLANLATTGAITTATYAGNGGTCSNTYCHGNFAGGAGGAATASWKTAAALACTSCHGNPPALTAASHHPANTACATCHGTGYTTAAVVQGTHVDGTVTLTRTGCTLCHGDLTQTAVAATSGAVAPGFNAASADTAGNVAATFAAVGAHAKHLNGSTLSSTPIACSACHAVPGSGDTAHATGAGTGGARATVAFSGLSVTGTPAITTAAYAGSTTAAAGNVAGTCSNTYCHGNFKNGATTYAPSWLGGAAAAACGTCHGLPPGGTHPASNACQSCHTGYTISSVNLANHLNGSVQIDALTCTSCHGDGTRVSVAGADANQASAPPKDSLGATTGVRVGVHAGHVNPAAVGAIYKPIACTECHPNNAGNNAHSNNSRDVSFALATAARLDFVAPATATVTVGNGSTTQTTCSTYCHGATLAAGYAGSVTSWTWNGAAVTCGSCHGFPPTTGGHTNVAASATACATCHPDTVNPTGSINVAGGKHINGVLDGGGEPATGGSSCGGCHATFFNQMTAVTSVPKSRHGIGSDVPADTTANWGASTTLLTAVPATADRTCVSMCHGDHPHNLTTPTTTTHETNVYVDATTSATRASGSTTRTTANRAKTDFDPATNAGVCTSCHKTPITTNHMTITAATFGASAHDFTQFPATTPTWTWTFPIHDGSTFARNCTKCHASRTEGTTPTATTTQSVHFSTDDAHLLAGTSNPGGVAASFVCFNCHGSTTSPAAGAQGNRSGKDIQTQLLHATSPGQSGHPSLADTVHDSGLEAGTAAFGNAFGVAAGAGQRHASCNDCHDPHAAQATVDPAPYTTGTVAISTSGTCPSTMGSGSCGTATGVGTTWTSAMVGRKLQVGTATYTVVTFTSATSMVVYPRPTTAVASGSAYAIRQYYRAGNVAGPAIVGSWGAQLSSNPAFWTTPATGNFTKQTLTATSLEATLCFKCHTGYYWGTGAPPAFPSAAPTYTTGTAVAALNGTTVTGTSTAWNAVNVGWTIRNNTVGVTHTVTAVASTTSLTISPAATAAWTGAYTMQAPSTFTYATGTATAPYSATATSTTVTGAGTAWSATMVGAVIKNNTLGIWHRITAVGSATSITIAPAATAAWTGAYTIQVMQGSDVAKEFNPANVGNYATTGTTSWQTNETAGGFHPVLATANGNLGATGNILPPFSRTTLMQCTDCHDSDAATDPNGPHGSAAKFLLKGPNTTWNSTIAIGGTSGMPTGTFCANCHRTDFVGGRFTAHTNGKHNIACMNCHAAVPHGGPRPGILAAGAGAAAAVGGTIAGWDTVAPYWQGGTSGRLYLLTYPTSNTSAWAQSNCGCNGTGH